MNRRHAAPATSNPEVTIVVPIFNESPNIKRLHQEMSPLRAALNAEIVVVDDGSTDGSSELVERCSGFRLIRQPRGGKSRSLHTGISQARADKIVMIDGDLQERPEDIPALIQLLDNGFDCVCGRRTRRQDSLLLKKLPSRVFNLAVNAFFRTGLHDLNCGFRACRKEALASIPWFDGCHRFIPLLMQRNGFKVTELAVAHRPRVAGVPKFTSPLRFFRASVHLVRIRLRHFDRDHCRFENAWKYS